MKSTRTSDGVSKQNISSETDPDADVLDQTEVVQHLVHLFVQIKTKQNLLIF